jgi:hypothetical protein
VLNYQAGLATVEYDISVAGYVVKSQNAGRTELDSGGANLEGVFVWDVVVAKRRWKRAVAAGGMPAGEWVPVWDKNSKHDGWTIPAAKKAPAKAEAASGEKAAE